MDNRGRSTVECLRRKKQVHQTSHVGLNKLAEDAAAVPQDPFQAFMERLPGYIRDTQAANTEASKALSFLIMIRQTFEGIHADRPSGLVPELEHYVHVQAGTVVVLGRIDALLGNLVIEFKKSLGESHLTDAKDQLRKYVAALWAIDGRRTNYMLMATDGLRFKVYKPTAPLIQGSASPGDISLEEVNLMDIESTPAEEAFRWLDRYVLWRERILPRTDEMSRDFGIGSPAFVASLDGLRRTWDSSRGTASAPFEEWAKYLRVVYGESVGDELLFLKHTYLATLAKLMVYTYYSGGAIPSRQAIVKVLSGEAFKEWGIENFLEEDFFSWLVRGEAREEGVDLAWNLLEVLERYDLSKLNEDVLKGLYQGLVDPADRHELGEYYTPDWLAEWIVDRVVDDPMMTVLDPACGSGTFLVATIRRKVATVGLEPHLLLVHLTASVRGIDVHPLAVLIAKANYLMALGELVKFKAGPVRVPVYLANSIDFPRAKQDVEHGVEVFRYPVSERDSLVIPREAVDADIVGEVVEAVSEFSRRVAAKELEPDRSLFERAASAQVARYRQLSEGSKGALWDTCLTLAKAHRREQGHDLRLHREECL